MSTIDEPGIKWEIFTRLNTELQIFRPDIAAEGKILCPVCGRALLFEDFSLEHIIPQRVLKKDPEIAKRLPRNERAGLTLLCKKNLVRKNGALLRFGCNQWKGKKYDQKLESHFLATYREKGMMEAFLAMAYLAMFSQYGYRVAFTTMGNLCRQQFLNPELRLKRILPPSMQVIMGFNREEWQRWNQWTRPFMLSEDEDMYGRVCVVGVRGFYMRIPISRPLSLSINSPLIIPERKRILRPDFDIHFEGLVD